MPFSVLIPNYNGVALLQEYLPSVLDAAEHSGEEYDIMVVDDGSTDGSGHFIRSKFSNVQVLENEKNIGFGATVNRGMLSSKHRIVMLLNNDVRVERDFFRPLLKHCDDPKIFGVVAKGLIEQDGIIKNESVTKLEYIDGFLNLIQPGLLNPEAKFDDVCTVAHACGGYSAFDREKFLKIGGFDDLFYPFYWEDVDICYRAWKRGWWTLYEPRSVAHHRCHSTTYNLHNREYFDMLHMRNMMLFTWKNITDTEMLVEHLHGVNAYLKVSTMQFNNGFYEALKKIEDVLRIRSVIREDNKLSDKEVLALSANVLFK